MDEREFFSNDSSQFGVSGLLAGMPGHLPDGESCGAAALWARIAGPMTDGSERLLHPSWPAARSQTTAAAALKAGCSSVAQFNKYSPDVQLRGVCVSLLLGLCTAVPAGRPTRFSADVRVRV